VDRKHFYLACVLALSVLATASSPLAADPRKDKAQEPASEKELRKTVSFLTKLKPARNYKHVKSLNKAAAHIRKQLEALGYKVREQVFKVEGKSYKNLITNVGPKDAPLVVLGAHYDVAGEKPGADDNASGVAGLLEVARLIKVRKPKLTYQLELVAYTLEEPPYFATKNMGSYHHAKSLADSKTEVRAMVCLEMIGFFTDKPGSQRYPDPRMKQVYPSVGNYIAVVGNPKSAALVKTVKALMKTTSKIDVQSLIAPAALKSASFSDHRNYWAFGFPAVMINDTAYFRTPHYHEDSDTPKTLDFKSMAQVVEGVYTAVTSDLK
jgi:Zn-dependent M28 family amino/carboxypeptidase